MKFEHEEVLQNKGKNEQTNKGNLKLGLQLICLEDVE